MFVTLTKFRKYFAEGTDSDGCHVSQEWLIDQKRSFDDAKTQIETSWNAWGITLDSLVG